MAFNIGGGDKKVSNTTNTYGNTTVGNGNNINGDVGSNNVNVTNNYIIGKQGGGDGAKSMGEDPFSFLMNGLAGGFGAGLGFLAGGGLLGKLFA